MNKYKIAVYAICKNEEKFVERWIESMSEADLIYVLDTGSTDNTVEKLRELGAIVVVEEIKPWRFDIARNKSLELVPDDVDICVCTDLDEIFEKGWRNKLEAAWKEDTKQASYRYTWSFNEDKSEGVVFWIEKIHANKEFKWIHPVHEVLKYIGNKSHRADLAMGVQLNHYPDPSKSRSQYLGLLELAVEERPNDDRNMHYLGREYMYKEMWDKAIETLQKHLAMPEATWKDERCASMRYISKSLVGKGDLEGAKWWLYRAIAEAPHLRESYIEMALLLSKCEEWYGVIFMVNSALKIENRPMTYINEAVSWGSFPYDLASIAYYWIGQLDKSLEFLQKAISLSPDDERLKKNYDFIKEKIPHRI